MSETLPRDLWVRQMEQLPPKTLLSSLTSYTTASSHATDHLAEYLKARASAEGEYVQVLQKLQRRFTLAQGGSERGENGEGGMSERFEEEIKLTIKTHSDYASILTRDYSEPLRTLPSLPPSSSDRLERTLKSYESANSKIAKAQKKGGAKLLAAQQDAADLQRQLSAQLVPEFIALAQQTTYHRLTMIKELGVKWETWQAEMGNRRAAASEVGMMQVLALDPEELVRGLPRTAFGVTAGSGGGFVDGSRPPAGTPTRSSTLRRPTLTSDASSARSSRHPSDFTSAAGPQTPSGGGSGGGFASTLKSKFGRKNSTMVPLGGGGSFRGRAGSDAAPASGSINAGRGQNMDSVSSRMQSGSTMPAALASPVPIEASTHAGGRPVDEEGFSVPPEDRGYAPWERNTQGGRRDLLDDDNDEESGYAGHRERDETITALPATASPLNESPSAFAQGSNNKFASLSLAPTPIQESETDRAAALAKMQSTLLSQGPAGTSNSGNGSAPNRRATMRARRDVRNTMFTAVDRAGDDTSLGETVKRQRGTSGDIFGGAVSPSAALTPTRGVAALATNVRADSAIPSPASTTMNPFDGHVSSAPMGSGLRASFTETVNAVLTSAGVQRIMITGEISLTLRDAHLGGLDTSAPLHIRLDAFEQLEKVAPNPKYLSQVPNVPGEYLLDLDTLAHITSAAAPNARPPILFKYQVHIGDGKAGEWAPLEIMPQWKPMKGETRLVLTYGVNTRGRLASRIASMETDGPLALQDLTLTVGLSGAPVTTVQAKPAGGTWQPERRKITWTLPDLPLGASATPSEGKIVARFITEGEEFGQPDQVTAQWRVNGTLSTGLDIVVVDPAAAWRFEQVRRGVVSGKYVAE